MARGVGEERIKRNVGVIVGRGVSVFWIGVIVGVGVAEGRAAAVLVDAATTVCAMKVLTATGFVVGTVGVPTLGTTHATISARARTQINNLVLCIAVIFSSSTSKPN